MLLQYYREAITGKPQHDHVGLDAAAAHGEAAGADDADGEGNGREDAPAKDARAELARLRQQGFDSMLFIASPGHRTVSAFLVVFMFSQSSLSAQHFISLSFFAPY